MSQKKLPLINSAHGSDTRNIINELIKLFNNMGYTYNESLQKAQDILDEAQQTNDMNESVQQQINALIAESGTSDSEVLQARIDAEGNEYPVLKNRLDESDVQLAETSKNAGVSFEEFGAVGDGVVDDTTAIKSAIEHAQTNGIYNVFGEKGKTYVLKEQVFITQSGLNVDFKGAKLLWLGEEEVNTDQGNEGMFNVVGSIDGESDLSYLKTLRLWIAGGNEHQVPANSRILVSIEREVSEKFVGSKVKTSENTHFAVGDEILMVGWTSRSPYSTNRFDIESRIVANVVKIDSEYIYTDYLPAFDADYINIPERKSMIVKVNLIKNVHIKNVEIEDGFKIAELDNPTSSELSKAVSGIVTMLADNCSINDVDVYENNYNAIFNWTSRNLKQRNINVTRPQMWSAGRGYAIKNSGITKSVFSTIHGTECRHVVDHAQSHHILNEKITSTDAKGSELNHHGNHEHDIYIKDCECTVSFGAGINNFPEVFGKITIENHVGEINHTKESYIKELNIINSHIQTLGFLQPANLRVTGGSWDMNLAYSTVDFYSRGIQGRTKHYIDTEIKLLDDNTGMKLVSISNIDEIVFGSNTSIATTFDPTVHTSVEASVVRLINFDKLVINDSIFDNVGVRVISNRPKTVINANGTQFSLSNFKTSFAYFMHLRDFTDCHLILNLNNVSFECPDVNADSTALFNIDGNSTSSEDTTTKIDIHLSNSTIGSEDTAVNNGIYGVYSYVNLMDNGNIIRNVGDRGWPSGHGFNEERNIII